MILTSKIRIVSSSKLLLLVILFVGLLGFTGVALAQSGLSISVTPSLIELSVEPGRTWESSVKVINNNQFDLTVYANVVNFAPQGESGQGAFLPIEAGGDKTTVAEWLTVSSDPIVIPRESSTEVPLLLTVPANAAPGGHYAAIMIGTKPPESSNITAVRTSQIVTALFFARVTGDVIENGTIRSFRPTDFVVGSPTATFELRFENNGNVHLQPQGEIVIKNMWGATRGLIPINRETHFGNVLPNSIRKFEFTWSGAFSLTDIGRYTAEVALAYGEDARKFSSFSTSFWVLPLKGITLALIVLFGLIFFLRFVVRSYVRRMLVLAGVDPNMGKRVPVSLPKLPGKDVRIIKTAMLTAPVKNGFSDFKSKMRAVPILKDKFYAVLEFIYQYKLFFISVLVFIVLVVGIIFFFKSVLTKEVPYEITVDREGEDVTLSSEQIEFDANNSTEDIQTETVVSDSSSQPFTLILTNASGKSGVAGTLKTELENDDYVVDELRSDLTGVKNRTVIIYSKEVEESALKLSERLNNALLSALSDTTGPPEIEVLIGTDYLEE